MFIKLKRVEDEIIKIEKYEYKGEKIICMNLL